MKNKYSNIIESLLLNGLIFVLIQDIRQFIEKIMFYSAVIDRRYIEYFQCQSCKISSLVYF